MSGRIEKKSIADLQRLANDIRKDILKMLLTAGSGHSAGPLGMADIFTGLYFDVLKHNPTHPKWEERDYVFLSNGHICPVWYVTLAYAGYSEKSELKTLRKINSRLQGHPNRLDLPGIENSSGPLGQGISQAIGAAVAVEMDNKKNQVYCLMGDGELNEGQCWEAFMFAGNRRVNNLTIIIDRNNIQIDGFTEDIMPLENLKDKLESFNLHVLEIDGHNIDEFIEATNKAKAIHAKTVVIIAHTIPGKGVEFMEFKPEWHGKPPNTEEAKKGIKEIRSLKDQIEWD
ncbi:MAG: transketolase [Candidatus Dojkabacteria bacterium]|nr:transketolase [Candidatus Dojkabacteria bacterium]MDQ7020829.1 transketolase [Candidatus Dojkabacteria bacterium]